MPWGRRAAAVVFAAAMVSLSVTSAASASPATAVAKSRSSGAAQSASPMSAHGCNNGVCIGVQGSGTHVDSVQVTADDGANPPCGLTTRASFFRPNGTHKYYDDPPNGICAYNLVAAYDTSWPAGTKVCGALLYSNGTRWNGAFPCETIG
jgi:hypothetical protein